MIFILLALITYLFAGILQNFLKNKFLFLSIMNFVGMIFVLIPSVQVLLNNLPIEYWINFSGLIGLAKFKLDSLSSFFTIIISLMSFLATMYAKGYLKPYTEKGKSITSHLFFFNLLILAMILVVISQNALFFLIVWEIMSISSLFLVGFENEKKEVLNASIKYLIYMHISVLFIMSAFLLINIKTGSFNFDNFKFVLQNNPKFANLFFFLTFIGFGTKAGFLPFHNWLPDAHPAAPSHVSGLMSGVMIKTGIYGILRMITLIGTPSLTISYTVLFIALISSMYGVLYAIAQHDLKKLLAYSSIENIGIIGLGIGCGTLGLAYNIQVLTIAGFLGALLHVLNHSIFKSLLFCNAGVVYNKTHTKNIEILGGLFKKMPTSAICFLIGAIAICGLPPFNGFISEIVIYFSMLQGMLTHNITLFLTLMFSLVGLAFVGVMAILCFTKAFSIVYLGTPRSETAQNITNDADISMKIPMITLSIFCLLIGIFPKYIIQFIKNILSIFMTTNDLSVYLPLTFINNINLICLILFVSCTIGIVCRYLFNSKRERSFEVWGCGYDKPNSKIQYTAASFTSAFLEITKPLFIKKVDIKKPDIIFPTEAHYKSEVEDIEEEMLIKPTLDFDKHFLEKFQVLQNGNLQQYILYGLVFLLIILFAIIITEI